MLSVPHNTAMGLNNDMELTSKMGGVKIQVVGLGSILTPLVWPLWVV
jgi:hypothetical protein